MPMMSYVHVGPWLPPPPSVTWAATPFGLYRDGVLVQKWGDSKTEDYLYVI